MNILIIPRRFLKHISKTLFVDQRNIFWSFIRAYHNQIKIIK